MEWEDCIEAKGYLWATPGRYLRQSMLKTLARRVSDNGLPQDFYNSTFQDTDDASQHSPGDEEQYAVELDLRMKDVIAETKKKDEDTEEDEESDDSDGEEESEEESKETE